MHLLVCYPKDVMMVRNVSYATAKRDLQRVRAHLGKPHRMPVTIAEYCAYFCLAEAEVRAVLGGKGGG